MASYLVLPSSIAWRRFFARMFDVYLEVLLLDLSAGLIFGESLWYVKFLNGTNDYIFGMIFLPFALILNAFICNSFGTSLGKYLLGIHVTKVEKISLKDWLVRSFRLWRSGFAFGIPLISLWTFNREQKLANKQEQTTYDKLGGFYVTANKLSKFQFARAFIAVVALFSLEFWLSFAQTEKDNSVQKVITAPPYHWQNPVTKADALVNAEWKNTFEKNEQGQPIYTFSEITGYALVVLALESKDGISLNTYVDLLRKGNEGTMTFNDGGRYLEKDGIEVWEGLGTMKSIEGSLLQIEIRKNGSDFWRIVSVQAQPYDYTNAKVEELKLQLWKTVLVNPSPLQ